MFKKSDWYVTLHTNTEQHPSILISTPVFGHYRSSMYNCRSMVFYTTVLADMFLPMLKQNFILLYSNTI